MGINNSELSEKVKEKFTEMENAINLTEKELLRGDGEFEKSKATFHFGRVQQIFSELYYYVQKRD